MHAIKLQLQTANYVLFWHLKFVKECRILPIIHTSRLPPQDHWLNWPLGGPEVGTEGTTERRQPPACVCTYCTCCQLLTDRQREEPDRPSPFGRCHAQMLRTGLTSMDRAKMRPWSDSTVGPRPMWKIKESWQQWGGGASQGEGYWGITIKFICLKSVTGVRQAAYGYWEKVCSAVSVF